MNALSSPRLEQLDPHDADRLSALVHAATRLGLEDARARLDALIQGTLSWSLASVDRALAAPQAFGGDALAAIALSFPEGPALVLVDPWLVHVAVDRVLGGEGARALDVAPLTDTEAGVFAFIVASMLVGTGVQVAGAHHQGAACAAWLKESPKESPKESLCDRWHWRVRAGDHHAFVTLWVSAKVTSRSLAEAASAEPEKAMNLPSTLQLRVGLATLTHAELDELAVGDVVLPETLSVSAPRGALVGEVAWCTARGEVFVETHRVADDEAWIVRTPKHPARTSHPAKLEASLSTEKRSIDLPITLTLTLGQITLTHAEAQAMLPGSVLKTAIPAGTQVQLVAGDTVVAQGELVEIQGELGVRILRVHG